MRCDPVYGVENYKESGRKRIGETEREAKRAAGRERERERMMYIAKPSGKGEGESRGCGLPVVSVATRAGRLYAGGQSCVHYTVGSMSSMDEGKTSLRFSEKVRRLVTEDIHSLILYYSSSSDIK